MAPNKSVFVNDQFDSCSISSAYKDGQDGHAEQLLYNYLIVELGVWHKLNKKH